MRIVTDNNGQEYIVLQESVPLDGKKHMIFKAVKAGTEVFELDYFWDKAEVVSVRKIN